MKEILKLCEMPPIDSYDDNSDKTELRIHCPFCRAPYTARMETDFDYSMGSEYTGIYDESLSVKIFCENCKKLIYCKS